jgi:hypothetical protein
VLLLLARATEEPQLHRHLVNLPRTQLWRCLLQLLGGGQRMEAPCSPSALSPSPSPEGEPWVVDALGGALLAAAGEQAIFLGAVPPLRPGREQPLQSTTTTGGAGQGGRLESVSPLRRKSADVTTARGVDPLQGGGDGGARGGGGRGRQEQLSPLDSTLGLWLLLLLLPHIPVHCRAWAPQLLQLLAHALSTGLAQPLLPPSLSPLLLPGGQLAQVCVFANLCSVSSLTSALCLR